MDGIIYAVVGGVPTEENAACVTAIDRGLLYGDGLFETLRLYDATPYLVEQHLARLARSAGFLGIPLPETDWEAELHSLADHNGHREGAARITLTRGVHPLGPRPVSNGSQPTLILQTRPLPPDLEQRRVQGIAGRTLPFPLRAEGLVLQGHKTTGGYLASVLALGKVQPGEEPVLETTGGAVSEGATSNLFWLRDDTLYTPGLDTGCLPGVTRAQVLELAAEMGLEVAEGSFRSDRLAQADEAFVTNAVTEIAPLTSLNDRPIGEGRPGTITQRLQQAYAARVARWRLPNP